MHNHASLAVLKECVDCMFKARIKFKLRELFPGDQYAIAILPSSVIGQIGRRRWLHAAGGNKV